MNYQVFKRGGPFSKKATDEQSLRLTREAYFKLVEGRSLGNMRDDMNSVMNSSFMTNTARANHSGFATAMTQDSKHISFD